MIRAKNNLDTLTVYTLRDTREIQPFLQSDNNATNCHHQEIILFNAAVFCGGSGYFIFLQSLIKALSHRLRLRRTMVGTLSSAAIKTQYDHRRKYYKDEKFSYILNTPKMMDVMTNKIIECVFYSLLFYRFYRKS